MNFAVFAIPADQKMSNGHPSLTFHAIWRPSGCLADITGPTVFSKMFLPRDVVGYNANLRSCLEHLGVRSDEHPPFVKGKPRRILLQRGSSRGFQPGTPPRPSSGTRNPLTTETRDGWLRDLRNIPAMVDNFTIVHARSTRPATAGARLRQARRRPPVFLIRNTQNLFLRHTACARRLHGATTACWRTYSNSRLIPAKKYFIQTVGRRRARPRRQNNPKGRLTSSTTRGTFGTDVNSAASDYDIAAAQKNPRGRPGRNARRNGWRLGKKVRMAECRKKKIWLRAQNTKKVLPRRIIRLYVRRCHKGKLCAGSRQTMLRSETSIRGEIIGKLSGPSKSGVHFPKGGDC